MSRKIVSMAAIESLTSVGNKLRTDIKIAVSFDDESVWIWSQRLSQWEKLPPIPAPIPES